MRPARLFPKIRGPFVGVLAVTSILAHFMGAEYEGFPRLFGSPYHEDHHRESPCEARALARGAEAPMPQDMRKLNGCLYRLEDS